MATSRRFAQMTHGVLGESASLVVLPHLQIVPGVVEMCRSTALIAVAAIWRALPVKSARWGRARFRAAPGSRIAVEAAVTRKRTALIAAAAIWHAALVRHA